MDAREVELVGGPGNGKRIAVDVGVRSIVIPVFDRSKSLPDGDVFLTMEFSGFTGALWPRLPIFNATYRENEEGQFEYSGAESQ